MDGGNNGALKLLRGINNGPEADYVSIYFYETGLAGGPKIRPNEPRHLTCLTCCKSLSNVVPWYGR